MKKKLLIFLLDTNWYPLKSSKFEIKEFDKDSIKVKIHEMVDILNPELEKNFVNTTSSKHIKSFKKLNDWNNELLELVKEYEKENILIINDVRKINWNSLKINYLIKKMKIRTLELTNLDIPGYEFHNLRKSVIGLFSIKIKKVILNKIYLFLKQKFFAYLKLVFKFYPNYFLVFGSKSVDQFKKTYENQGSKMLLGNSLDYNLYLSNKKTTFTSIIKKEYALFLESPFPFFLGDTVILGEGKLMLGDPLKWEISFNNFCTFIEKKFNLEVFIANHPRVKHESQNPKYYRGRTVLTDPLFNTSKNAKLLINRTSTGIAYGIIHKIPIMFINSSNLLNSRPNLFMRQNFLASQLGRSIINIDEDLNEKLNEDIFQINEEKYNEYRKNFITSRDDGILNSNIIKEIL